jgi:hypothetical protein
VFPNESLRSREVITRDSENFDFTGPLHPGRVPAQSAGSHLHRERGLDFQKSQARDSNLRSSSAPTSE